MHAEIKDPDEKIVLSRIYSAEGGFYSTTADGVRQINEGIFRVYLFMSG